MKCLIFILRPGLLLMMALVLTANDWEYWSHFEAGGKINPRLSYKVAPEFRFNDNFTNHYYTHLEAGLDWKVTSRLSLSLAGGISPSTYSDNFLEVGKSEYR